MDALSLDQFATFAVVAEEGSFAAAARRLGRAQSAITYAIQKLEAQTGAPLFDRSAYRPQLTEAGRALLPHAKRILTDVASYRRHAKAMAAGVEAEIRIMLPDVMPRATLVAALAELRSHYPPVQLRIATGSGWQALRELDAGRIDLAVVLDHIELPQWFERKPSTKLQLVVAASPQHPLTAVPAPIPPEILADHLQIIVSSRSEADDATDHGVVATNRWYTTDYPTKRALLLAGLGWGSMPIHLIEADIRTSQLASLTVQSWDGAATPPELPLVVGTHANRFHGPATRLLARLLALGD